MILEQPELMIEFLVPELGRGSKGLQNLPKLKMNAQALRFMGIPMMMIVRLAFGNVSVNVPHPAAFALHKLLVAPHRENLEKKRKDLDAAALVLDLLKKKRELRLARDLLADFPPAWKTRILAILRREHMEPLANYSHKRFPSSWRVSGHFPIPISRLLRNERRRSGHDA